MSCWNTCVAPWRLVLVPAPRCGTVRHNQRMPEFSSISAFDALLDDMRVGEARWRQLGMVRGELERALARGALPVGARRSLRRLLEPDALRSYVRLASSGTLRARRVQGGYPPTSDATNEARVQCFDLPCGAYGLPAPRLGAGGRVPPQPAPAFGTLAALRRQLDQDLGGYMSPGHTRLAAVVALVLDTAPRSGELFALRLSDLRPGAVYVDWRPQHGGPPDGDWFELSPLSTATLDRWVDVRKPRNEPTEPASCG